MKDLTLVLLVLAITILAWLAVEYFAPLPKQSVRTVVLCPDNCSAVALEENVDDNGNRNQWCVCGQ